MLCCVPHSSFVVMQRGGVPDALSLINVNDIHHLEHLTWAIYDDALIVGQRPALVGNLPWHTMLDSLGKHIYRGHEDVAHCLPFTLALWDCKERLEVLHREGHLDMEQSRQCWRSRLRGRSRSGSRCHSWTPRHGEGSGPFHSSSPGSLSKGWHRAVPPPISDPDTVPKVASTVNVPLHAQCSHSSSGDGAGLPR